MKSIINNLIKMNKHFILFQNPLDYFKLNKNYLDLTNKEICLDADDKEICLNKHKAAFELVVKTLQSQLDAEAYLDIKYEKMDKFKKIRGDRDANEKLKF